MFIVAEIGGISYSHRFMALMGMGSRGELFMIAKSLDFLIKFRRLTSILSIPIHFIFIYLFSISLYSYVPIF